MVYFHQVFFPSLDNLLVYNFHSSLFFSIHFSIFFYLSGSQWQQAKQLSLDIPLRCNLFQLFLGDSEAFPGQMRYIVPPVIPVSTLESPPSRMHFLPCFFVQNANIAPTLMTYSHNERIRSCFEIIHSYEYEYLSLVSTPKSNTGTGVSASLFIVRGLQKLQFCYPVLWIWTAFYNRDEKGLNISVFLAFPSYEAIFRSSVFIKECHITVLRYLEEHMMLLVCCIYKLVPLSEIFFFLSI